MSLNENAQDTGGKLSQWRELIHSELVAVGDSSSRDSKRLQAATAYVLQGHGKRLRGLLALSVEHDLRGGGERLAALKAAVALEMLHAASLVHDDLPALDNDDMRRGRPSCHRAFNEATAILTGDYLVGRAFSVIGDGSLIAARQLRVLAILAQAWGDLCIGQQVDIEKPKEPEQVERLMELKTGALFGAAAACGAVCADRDEAEVARFYEWGKRVGVLFQKLDDAADGDGSSTDSCNQVEEVQALRGQITDCGGIPLTVTETLYSVIVGELS